MNLLGMNTNRWDGEVVGCLAKVIGSRWQGWIRPAVVNPNDDRPPFRVRERDEVLSQVLWPYPPGLALEPLILGQRRETCDDVGATTIDDLVNRRGTHRSTLNN